MAVSSVSASKIPCLSSDRSARFGLASAVVSSSSSSSSIELSSLSSLQFPVRTCRLRNGSVGPVTSPRPRILPLVKAKKQTFTSFDDMLANSEKPVLVDFYATWCGPCQFMVPVLDEVSNRLRDVIQVAKVDTEKYPSIADKYSIQALPTFIIFKDGKPVDRFEGTLTADQLIQRIDTSLKVKQ